MYILFDPNDFKKDKFIVKLGNKVSRKWTKKWRDHEEKITLEPEEALPSKAAVCSLFNLWNWCLLTHSLINPELNWSPTLIKRELKLWFQPMTRQTAVDTD